jgi:hypothetical protein
MIQREKIGGFIMISPKKTNRDALPGNPAISRGFKDPWLSVPALQRVWLYLVI